MGDDYCGLLLKYGGMIMQNLNNELASRAFVDQDMLEYIKEYMPSGKGRHYKRS